MRLTACAVAIGLLAVFAAHFAAGQGPTNDGTLSITPLSAAGYCGKFAFNKYEFIRSIKMIISHGQLSDILFTEKALGTKFAITFGTSEDGTPDHQIVHYDSGDVLGSPVDVEVDVWPNDMQRQMGVADIDIQNRYFPQGPSNFIDSCLRIQATELTSSIGARFFPLPASPNPGRPIEFAAGAVRAGPNETTLYIVVHYSSDNIVSGLQIIQNPSSSH